MKVKKILELAVIGATGVAAAPFTGGTSIAAAATFAGVVLLKDEETETETKKQSKKKRK